MRKHALGRVAATAAALLALTAPSLALDERTTEKEEIRACEKRLCEIVLKKEEKGENWACKLSKTWAKKKIVEGSEKRKLSWSFGDARCAVGFDLPREAILAAVTKPDHTLEFKPETAKCEIERENNEVTTIDVTLAPKVTFKDGRAAKAWLNVSKIEAPAVVKGAIWTAATLEDTFGVFHGDILREINELVGERCQERYAAK